MITLYKVNSDKNLFDQYREMASRLNEISVYFQNPNQTLIEEELSDWKQRCNDYRKGIEILFSISESRITAVAEDEQVYEQKMIQIRREHYWL